MRNSPGGKRTFDGGGPGGPSAKRGAYGAYGSYGGGAGGGYGQNQYGSGANGAGYGGYGGEPPASAGGAGSALVPLNHLQEQTRNAVLDRNWLRSLQDRHYVSIAQHGSFLPPGAHGERLALRIEAPGVPAADQAQYVRGAEKEIRDVIARYEAAPAATGGYGAYNQPSQAAVSNFPASQQHAQPVSQWPDPASQSQPQQASAAPARADGPGGRWRVFIDINPPPAFGLVSKLRGPKDSYLEHIQQESAKLSGADIAVTLRGRGSGTPASVGPGSDDPLHIALVSTSAKALHEARDLANNLLDHVRREFVSQHPHEAAAQGYGSTVGALSGGESRDFAPAARPVGVAPALEAGGRGGGLPGPPALPGGLVPRGPSGGPAGGWTGAPGGGAVPGGPMRGDPGPRGPPRPMPGGMPMQQQRPSPGPGPGQARPPGMRPDMSHPRGMPQGPPQQLQRPPGGMMPAGGPPGGAMGGRPPGGMPGPPPMSHQTGGPGGGYGARPMPGGPPQGRPQGQPPGMRPGMPMGGGAPWGPPGGGRGPRGPGPRHY
ncbi:unnamed protein product [Pedinophyceae sp. YPF-701]|nr:unnamed protein product [Pedinophyceae sp. YPF-701]